jgi:hypothetical protein
MELSCSGPVGVGGCFFSVPSGVPKVTNEVKLGEFWFVSATVSCWDCGTVATVERIAKPLYGLIPVPRVRILPTSTPNPSRKV